MVILKVFRGLLSVDVIPQLLSDFLVVFPCNEVVTTIDWSKVERGVPAMICRWCVGHVVVALESEIKPRSQQFVIVGQTNLRYKTPRLKNRLHNSVRS